MQSMIEHLRTVDCGDESELRGALDRIADAFGEEHHRLLAENDDLRRRVSRLETALLGIAGATSIINRPGD